MIHPSLNFPRVHRSCRLAGEEPIRFDLPEYRFFGTIGDAPFMNYRVYRISRLAGDASSSSEVPEYASQSAQQAMIHPSFARYQSTQILSFAAIERTRSVCDFARYTDSLGTIGDAPSPFMNCRVAQSQSAQQATNQPPVLRLVQSIQNQ